MELKSLSDQDLLTMTKQKALQEQALTLEVVKLIREVESRMLYLKLGFGSLFDYVTKELGFEESAACRRIAAARLIRDIPEVEQRISNGNLSLSNAARAQSFFKKEEKLHQKLTSEEKKEVIHKLENKSAREAEKVLLELSPKQVQLNESQKPVTSTHTEIRVVISEKLRLKLERLKSLLSHQNSSMSGLLEKLTDLGLQKWDPKLHKERGGRVQSNKKTQESHQDPEGTQSPSTSAVTTATAEPKIARHESQRRYIPSVIKRAVWARDRGCCSYVDPISNRRCDSEFQLEYHHIKAFGKGGSDSVDNLTLTCRQHNIYWAVKDFGKNKMQKFVNLG